MTNLTKSEIAAVCHAAAKRHLEITVPAIQAVTQKMELGKK